MLLLAAADPHGVQAVHSLRRGPEEPCTFDVPLTLPWQHMCVYACSRNREISRVQGLVRARAWWSCGLVFSARLGQWLTRQGCRVASSQELCG
jgi:hypothetical protein